MSADAVTLYVMTRRDATGVAARARVARLDLAAHMVGEAPPSEDRSVRQFLRGSYAVHPLGPQMDLCEPLYPGDIRALVDAILRPGWQQLRDHAYLLTMNSTGLRWEEMNRLTWSQIRLGKAEAEIRTELRKGRYGPRRVSLVMPARTNRILCPVGALRALHASRPPQPARPVFSTRGGNVKSARLRALAREVDRHRDGAQRLGEPTLTDEEVRRLARPLLAPLPIDQRDRFMVLAGFLGGLTPTEALNLRIRDVQRTPRGLVLQMPLRPFQRVALPARAGSPYCPRVAWDGWRKILRAAGHDEPDAPVFIGCDPYLPKLGTRRLRLESLSDVIASRAAEAGLVGHYTFSSLKDGLIRAATVAGTAHHDIAAHVGHRTLVGIASRDLEESAMGRNILRLVAL
jgi:integrase